MKMISDWIRKSRFLLPKARKVKKTLKDLRNYHIYGNRVAGKRPSETAIFYIGIPAHTNLGDLAQGVCIRNWLRKHYDLPVYEVETDSIVNTRFSIMHKLKNAIRDNDLIVFQSGYTTTDLGGYADEMHRAIINEFPNNPILMMPQTIFFQDESNKKRTSEVYSKAKRMLFLARDKVSYDEALKMFKEIPVELYPDIVTSMIGTRDTETQRDGILFCCRDDGEKYYSNEELAELIKKCSEFGATEVTDTTLKGKTQHIVENAESLIDKEIDKYAHYKVVITDRYHGTIFSLAAGTPVIVLKTTDHKVVTGADWFSGVYDDHVFLAQDLNHAYEIVEGLLSSSADHKMAPYFEKKYYDKLPYLVSQLTQFGFSPKTH